MLPRWLFATPGHSSIWMSWTVWSCWRTFVYGFLMLFGRKSNATAPQPFSDRGFPLSASLSWGQRHPLS